MKKTHKNKKHNTKTLKHMFMQKHQCEQCFMMKGDMTDSR